MRQVDTEALDLVAPSLGIGAPGTATAPVIFDDDTLVQVLDVNLSRRTRGFTATLQLEDTALATTIVRDGFTWAQLWAFIDQNVDPFRLGLGPDNADVWVTGLQCLVDDDTGLDEVQCGLVMGEVGGIANARALTLMRADAVVSTSALVAGDGEVLDNDLSLQDLPPYPIRMDGSKADRQFVWMVDAGAQALTLIMRYRIYVGLEGLPIFHAIG